MYTRCRSTCRPQISHSDAMGNQGSLPLQRHGSPLRQQVAFEEVDGPVVDELRWVEAGKSGGFTLERHVLDRAAQLTQPADHLIGLLARDARIVVALEHQERAAHVFDIGDWRTFDELPAVGLEVA